MSHRTSIRHLYSIMLAALALALPAASQAQTGYTIVDLGTLGGKLSQGYGINASGQVAGFAYITGRTTAHAVLWTGTTLTDLRTMGGDNSYGYALNASGQVTGQSYLKGDNASHAFRFSGRTLTDLGTLGGRESYGRGINASGQIAGRADTASPAIYHAVRWTGTTIEDLGTLGGHISEGNAINDSGQIAGDAQTTGDAATHAVRWTGAAAEDLGTLGGRTSIGYAINASGQVAGYSYLANNTVTHAVRWTGTTIEDLGTLGGSEGYGYGINRFGAVVGHSYLTNGPDHAFLYANGRMIDLNTLLPANSGWELTQAYGINDDGWITGTGTINAQSHAFLLRPVASAGTSRIAIQGVADLSATNPATPLGAFHFSLRAPGTTTELYGKDVALTTTPGSAFGTYTLTGIPNRAYDIAIKGDKSLRVLIPNFTINGTASLPDVTLPAGDANNDNSVDIGDFGVLVNAFGGDASLPGSGYDLTADFNYDGMDDIADFGLLVANYGNSGDP